MTPSGIEPATFRLVTEYVVIVSYNKIIYYRIRRIEGLNSLIKLEVLDFHGNQITQVGGLSTLSELKVLNLAGNQIRVIGASDLRGLRSLQELNLRRNRIKHLLGFGETPKLQKLFLSNNELHT